MIEIHVFIVVLKLIKLMIPCLFIFIEYMVQMVTLLYLVFILPPVWQFENIDELISKRMHCQVRSFHR